jgi:hypothetical membrane protein
LKEHYFALCGFLGPLIAIVSIAVAIVLSPGFSWESNALSDLGHSVNSDVAPLFNSGLLLCGFFIIFYSITSFRLHAKYTSYFLLLTGLALQLVAAFDEVYGLVHFQVSVLFFASLGLASFSYSIEKRSVLAVTALFVGFVSWILYGLEVFGMGIAVPETISSMATATWVVISALRAYFAKSTL